MTSGEDGDKVLVQALDAVDDYFEAQSRVHEALSEGFMALAREQMSAYTAQLRLSSLLYDARDTVSATFRVCYDENGELRMFTPAREDVPAEAELLREGVRKRKASGVQVNENVSNKPGQHSADVEGRTTKNVRVHSIHAMPSAALREASACFTRALESILATANAAHAVDKHPLLANTKVHDDA